MRVRWMLAIAIAIVLCAWFVISSREPHPAVDHTADSQPISQSSAADTTKPPSTLETVDSADVRVPVVSDPPADGAKTIVDPAQSSVRLYGLVLPPSDAEVVEVPATVGITDRFGERRSCDVGLDGEYEFSKLSTGRYWIFAQSSISGEVRSVIDIDAAAGDRQLDLRLERPLDILVEVVDRGGFPIKGVALIAVATIEAPGDWLDLVPGIPSTNFGIGVWTENGNADAIYPSPVYGRVRMSVPPPVFISVVHVQRVIATQRIEPGEKSVRFVLDTQSKLLQKGSLHLRLIDAQTRQPLALALNAIQAGTMGTSSSGSDGNYSGTFPPGWMGLNVLGSRQYESLDLNVRIDAGAQTDLGDVEVGSAVSISGVVTDENGQGVPTRISYDVIEPSTGGTIVHAVRFVANSAADGTFRIGGLSRRHYRLSLDNRESKYGIQAVEVDASAGSIEGLHIQLAPGIPLLISSSGDRWSTVKYSVIDAHGTRLRSSRLFGPAPQKILLAPGHYEIEVRIGESSETVWHAITIANDPVDLSLP